MPIDSWQLGDANYFVFELQPVEGAPPGFPVPAALFQMSWEQGDPHTAVVFTLTLDRAHAEVQDLRQDVPPQTIPLASTAPADPAPDMPPPQSEDSTSAQSARDNGSTV